MALLSRDSRDIDTVVTCDNDGSVHHLHAKAVPKAGRRPPDLCLSSPAPSQAFSHWSYHNTNGQKIVVDIQGVGDLYTDPQVRLMPLPFPLFQQQRPSESSPPLPLLLGSVAAFVCCLPRLRAAISSSCSTANHHLRGCCS